MNISTIRSDIIQQKIANIPNLITQLLHISSTTNTPKLSLNQLSKDQQMRVHAQFNVLFQMTGFVQRAMRVCVELRKFVGWTSGHERMLVKLGFGMESEERFVLRCDEEVREGALEILYWLRENV